MDCMNGRTNCRKKLMFDGARCEGAVVRFRVRPHSKWAAAEGRPSREIAAVCDLVTPDRAAAAKSGPV